MFKQLASEGSCERRDWDLYLFYKIAHTGGGREVIVEGVEVCRFLPVLCSTIWRNIRVVPASVAYLEVANKKEPLCS